MTLPGGSGALKTEADVIRTLDDGTYTIPELYELIAARADIARDRGMEPPDAEHPTDRVWRRRVRGVLQTLRNTGDARRVSASVWALSGTREHPKQLVLIARGGTLQQIELLLKDAVALLSELEEPADLVLCDPPYALGRGTSASKSALRAYRRDEGKVIGGYVDVPADEYREFTFGWVAAAALALRPAGQLAVITGPQQAALVQTAAEESGLQWVNSIPAFKEFALRTTRRFAYSHWQITVLCRGRAEDRRRVFNTPVDLPKARSGVDYPLDWWPENGRGDRAPGLLRYDNSLPSRLVRRIIEAFTNRRELVLDAFLGGGTSAIQARALDRRFIGGDVNPEAVRFTAARLLSEHAWPAEHQPPLFQLAA